MASLITRRESRRANARAKPADADRPTVLKMNAYVPSAAPTWPGMRKKAGPPNLVAVGV